MSTSITHRSGTLLRASPPTIRPRLIEGRSNSSELCLANGSDSILRKTSIALRTALSPSQGVAPCAAVPPTSSRSASTPLASIPMWRSVGSPVIAKSPMKPLSTRWSEPRSALLLGLLVADDPEPHPDPVLLAHRRGRRASSPRSRPSCRRRRARRAGRPRPAARTARRAPGTTSRCPCSTTVGAPSGPTSALITGSPRTSSRSASIPRASSHPWTNPAASEIASGSQVS